MQVRSRSLPVSILILGFIISLFLITPRSEANNSSQDPPAGTRRGDWAGPSGSSRSVAGNQALRKVITKEAKSDEGSSRFTRSRKKSITKSQRAN